MNPIKPNFRHSLPLFLLWLFLGPSLFAQKNKSANSGESDQKSAVKAVQVVPVKSYSEPVSKPTIISEPSQTSRSYTEPQSVTYDSPNSFGDHSTTGSSDQAPTTSRGSNSQSWPQYDYVKESPSADRPTNTQKSGWSNTADGSGKKEVGEVRTVRDQPSGAQIAMDSVRFAEAEIAGLLEDPNWIDPTYVGQLQAQLQILENQLAHLSGEEHAHCHQVWVFHQHFLEEQTEFWRILKDYQSYFAMKVVFLQEIQPLFGVNTEDRKLRDSLFGLPSGGWEYLEMVNAWNPVEISLNLADARTFSWECTQFDSYQELQLFFVGFMQSRLREELDKSIAEHLDLAYSLASTDPEKSTYIIENAYFLLRAADLLSMHDARYTSQLIVLDKQYPGMAKLVSDNLILTYPYFNEIVIGQEPRPQGE
jgi:hypothetical protein